MKKLLIALILTLFLTTFLAGNAFALSSMEQSRICKGNLCTVRLVCTTDGSGDFDSDTTMAINGLILSVETDPDGTAIPSDNYDINLQSQKVVNVAGTNYTLYRNIDGDTGTWTSTECTTGEDGTLANRDTATTERIGFSGLENTGPILVDLSNMGNSKITVIDINYLRTSD